MITENRPSLIKRKPSFSFKKQTNDSQNIEETKSSHARDYRILTYCFYNNINEYYSKRHKDVLGELEDCYKLPLAKEEKMFIKQNLDSFLDKNIFKLTKEILMRNVCIAKNINNYSENYNKITKSTSTQATNLLDIESMESNHKDNRSPSHLKESIKKRPSSSSKNQEKRFIDSPQHKNSPNRIISMGKYSYGCSEVNNDQTEPYVYMRENWRRVSKTKFHSKYLKCKDRIVLLEEMDPSGIESDTYMIKNKSEIMEVLDKNEKSMSQLNEEKGQKVKIESREEQGTFAYDLRSMKTKGSINKFFNSEITNNTKQNSIEEMEKIKVQNRILSISNNFLTGITKSQGYKPKSKCWPTPVNSITKLNRKDRTHFRSTVHEGSLQETNSNNERETRFLSTFLRYKP